MPTVTINHFGISETIDVAEEQLITFPSGLVGCADWRRFVLVSDDELPGLHTLHSLDVEHVQLLVADPALIVQDYRAGISPEELHRLELQSPDDAVMLCILTTYANPPRITANLLGPLVVNPSARVGLQLVLLDSPYSTRHPVNIDQPSEG